MTCYHCGSENIVKNGVAPNGKQKYRCKSCKKQSRPLSGMNDEEPSPNGYTENRKEEILSAYEERSSLRGLERTFRVARSTVSRWLKKNEEYQPYTLVSFDTPERVELELDEMHSFVQKKSKRRWLWVALWVVVQSRMISRL